MDFYIDDDIHFINLIKLIDNLNFAKIDMDMKEFNFYARYKLVYNIPKDNLFFKLVDDIFGVKGSLYLLISGFSYSFGLFNVSELKYLLPQYDNCLFFDNTGLGLLNDLLFNPEFDFRKYVLKKKISEIL
jgi:hypothetical protein